MLDDSDTSDPDAAALAAGAERSDADGGTLPRTGGPVDSLLLLIVGLVLLFAGSLMTHGRRLLENARNSTE